MSSSGPDSASASTWSFEDAHAVPGRQVDAGGFEVADHVVQEVCACGDPELVYVVRGLEGGQRLGPLASKRRAHRQRVTVADGHREPTARPHDRREHLDRVPAIRQVHEDTVGADEIEPTIGDDCREHLEGSIQHLDLHVSRRGRSGADGPQHVRGLHPGHDASCTGQVDRLGPLTTSHVEDRHAGTGMLGELPPDQVLPDGVAQVAEPADPCLFPGAERRTSNQTGRPGCHRRAARSRAPRQDAAVVTAEAVVAASGWGPLETWWTTAGARDRSGVRRVRSGRARHPAERRSRPPRR